jgi:hypothetical protein
MVMRLRCAQRCWSVLLIVGLAQVASASGWPQGELVLKTRDGKQRVGPGAQGAILSLPLVTGSYAYMF